MNKKAKKSEIIKEIASINREFSIGSFRCRDCGGKQITYVTKKEALDFDISNDIIREKIKNSLFNEIDSIEKELAMIDIQEDKINKEKDILINKYENNVKVDDILKNFCYCIDISKYNDELIPLVRKQKSLEQKINKLKSNKNSFNERKKFIRNYILNKMSIEYNILHKGEPYKFNDFFTKRTENFSGSENQIFLSSRILAIMKYFKLPFPIVIDSFREGEISTKREEIMLNRFSKLENQIILSCTLKDDEYSSQKYSDYKNINSIDYSNITEYHLLTPAYRDKFQELVLKFGVIL